MWLCSYMDELWLCTYDEVVIKKVGLRCHVKSPTVQNVHVSCFQRILCGYFTQFSHVLHVHMCYTCSILIVHSYKDVESWKTYTDKVKGCILKRFLRHCEEESEMASSNQESNLAWVPSWWREFSGQNLTEFRWHILSGCQVCGLRHFSISCMCSAGCEGLVVVWLL